MKNQMTAQRLNLLNNGCKAVLPIIKTDGAGNFITLKILVLLAVLFPAACFAQYTISGRVLNTADSKPVINASVFLSNATIGSKTTDDGTFILHNVKPGKYDLVISIVGFDTYKKTVTINNENIALPTIQLSPKTIILQEVTIKSGVDPDRERNYDLFTAEFLGRSYVAKDCKILNPEMLDLTYDKKTNILTASSVDFLEIENPSLGYKVKYLLTNFTLDNKDQNARKIHFDGNVLFEKMKGTPAQEQMWQKRRQDVYEGSLMHFLRSALNNRLDDEGFRVLQFADVPDAKKNGTLMHFPLTKADIVKPTDQQGVYAMGCDDDDIHVTYSKKHRFSKNGQLAHLGDADNTNVTILSFKNPYVLFDNNGGVINPDSYSFNGAWGRMRVGDLLPVDYEPESSENNLATREETKPSAIAPQTPLRDSLLAITAKADSLSKNFAAEKLYVQFDKPYYAAGDTIWLKAYLFNAPTLLLSAKSGLLHIDITTDSGKLVKQYLLPVKDGTSWGNISLDTDIYKTGSYTLHAYTNWMRNFGNDAFFSKHLYVAGSGENSWLINTKVSAANAADKLQINSQLQFTDINKVPIANQLLQLKVYSGTKNWYRQQVSTDANGMLDANFSLPQKATNLSIIAENKDDGTTAVIPLLLNRTENIDLQFMPEGGNLVAGLPARIGFKAVGENGKGTDISGTIVDHSQQQVAVFQSSHNGMGSVMVNAKAGEVYIARVNLPDGKVKEYALSAVKPAGTILQVKNGMESDSLEVAIGATDDIARSGNSYFLIGKARGIVCYAAIVDFKNGSFIRRKISKGLFPSGIVHFILMTQKEQPLNERLAFIDHMDNLNIDLSPKATAYFPKDSVEFRVNVTDNIGKPVAGNFSLSVTDDAQVKADSLLDDNISSRLLLNADLKGYIETPGYYLDAKNIENWRALDNLLLTQGWVNYDWQPEKGKPVFDAESEFTVKGRVLNVLNNSVKGTHVQLLSKTPLLASDTVTDKEGRFVFNNFPRIDTPVFQLRAVNRKGKSFNVGIQIDYPKTQLFKAIYPVAAPWYVNGDATMINYSKSRDSVTRLRDDFEGGGHRLKEVKILAKKIVHDSQNLNGTGEADLVLDEKDMVAAGKKSWLDIFHEKIPGFHEGSLAHRFDYYFIHDKKINIIIDGLLLDRDEMVNYHPYAFSPDTYQIYLNNIIDFLKSHSAEDIKGIEVNASKRYNMIYDSRFYPMAFIPPDFAYIEITTRSGKGPYMNYTPGTFLYKPLALSWPKQFYKPRYIVNDTTKRLPDLRSTIDWEPNIVTDKDGNATVSFFAADKPSIYTLIFEGTDGNGNIGYKRAKIKIEKSSANQKSK